MTVEGHLAWEAGQSVGYSAHSDGTFVDVEGLGAGSHTVAGTHTTPALYSFNDGTPDGWRARANVTSVPAVTVFASGPGTPFNSKYALDAASAPVAASAPKSVQIIPGQPLDLARAKTFFAYVDGYGGAPGAFGYQARVTPSGGSQTLTTTVPVAHDAWTPARTWTSRPGRTGTT